jgi:hypothetical protein
MGLGLTFARGLASEQMLAGLGLSPQNLVYRTFEEEGADPDQPRVRVGEHEGWGYAVEGFTQRGLQRVGHLSVAGGEAFFLGYTLDIGLFQYYAGGEFVSGFDLTVPHVRWGREPHRFEATMAQAGFLGPSLLDPPATGARFVQLTFGITIDRDMLERPLLSAQVV